MPVLDKVDIYVFDIFELSQVDELKSKLDSQFGPSTEHPLTLMQGSIVQKETKDMRHIWEVKDHNVIIDKAVEIGKGGLVGDVTLARNAIDKIEILGIESEIFPFYILMMIVSVKKSLLDVKKIFDESTAISRPLRIFFEEYNGITRQIRRDKPICPYFIDIHIIESEVEFQKIVDNLSTLNHYTHNDIFNEDRFKSLLDCSQKIRDIIPLQNLKREFHILSAPVFHEKFILFTGHLDQIGFNGLMTPFALHFSTSPFPSDLITFSGSGSIRPSSYGNLLIPNYLAGTMIYLTSVLGWSSFLITRHSKMESELNDTRKNILKQLESYETRELEKHLKELVIHKAYVVDIIAKLGRLRRHAELNLSDFLSGRHGTISEIPIPPPTNVHYFILKEITGEFGSDVFVQGLSKKVVQTLKKIQSDLNQYNRDAELVQNNMNDIISLENQRDTKKHNKMMKVLTIAILILAGMGTPTAVQLGIDLVGPDFIVNRPHIVLSLNPHTLDQVEFKTPIKLQTATNNAFRYSVYVVEDGFEVEAFGKCFFKDTPSISSSFNQPFFLSPDNFETDITPNFRLNYETTLPYFSPEKLERTVYHSVGEMKFIIFAEDTSDPSKSYSIPVYADVSMSPPGGLHFDASEHCEKIKKLDE